MKKTKFYLEETIVPILRLNKQLKLLFCSHPAKCVILIYLLINLIICTKREGAQKFVGCLIGRRNFVANQLARAHVRILIGHALIALRNHDPFPFACSGKPYCSSMSFSIRQVELFNLISIKKYCWQLVGQEQHDWTCGKRLVTLIHTVCSAIFLLTCQILFNGS